MNTSYQIVEAKSMDGGELAISLPWEFELSEIFVVAEHEKSGIAKVYEGSGRLTVDGDGNLVVPALFGGDAFRVWVSRKTQIRHDYDSGGDVIDDKTIDSELKELSRKTVENEKELARSVRVPEGGVNMILPSKVFRAGEIVGFDEDGNVSVGKGIPRIAELYANFEKVESSRKEAARHESVAKQNADIAIENRIAANKSAEDAHKYAQQLSGIYRYCGTVATEADLPTENNINGDVWNVADTGQNFAWDGEAWDALGGFAPTLQRLFSGHDGSNIDVGSARTFLTTPVDGGYFSGFQLSDFASRIFAVSPDGSMNGFMAMAADGVATNRVFGAPLQLGVPAEDNDEAVTLGQVKEQFTPLLETVPPEATDNADAFGYLGTLRSLGAFGGAVLVSRISVFNRSSGSVQNGNVSIWARVLKIVDGAWVVAAQSENSVKWNDYEHNAEISFLMRPVSGITPPSSDETIAIVFVNSETAEAGVSNGTLSFRTISLQGGIAGALNAPDNLNAGNSWSPRVKLRFAALSAVSREEITGALSVMLENLENADAALDSKIAAAKNDALSKTQSATQNVVGEILFNGGIRADSFKTLYGTDLFTTVASKGFDFTGVYRMFPYGNTDTPFFESKVVGGTDTWLRADHFILGGEDITNLFPLDKDVVHREGDETIAGAKTFTSSLGLGGKTLLETNVGTGVLKFAPVGSTAQTVLKRDGTNVVVQTQNAGVVQTTWTLPGGKTGVVALTSDLDGYVKLGTPNGSDGTCTYLVAGDSIGRLAACENDSVYVLGLNIHDAIPGSGITFHSSGCAVKIYNSYAEISFPTHHGTVALTSDVSAVDLTEGGTISGSLEFVSETGLKGAIVPNAYGFMFAPDSYSDAEVGFGSIRGGPCVYTYNNTILTFPSTAGGEVVVATLADLTNYVPKSDYDALLARVEALEAAAG